VSTPSFRATQPLVLFLSLLAGGLCAQAQVPKPQSLEDFVTYMQAHHKAPFDREGAEIPPGGRQQLVQRMQKLGAAKLASMATAAATTAGTNVKVNRDRNPWPKAEIGMAVDPINGKNFVVMSNDFRENYDHQFFHVSTNGGLAWTDDSMVIGVDPVTSDAPYNFQSDPGVAFDNKGQSYQSTISGNTILDFNVDGIYENFDTQVEEVQGFSNGTYASLVPTIIDNQQCSGATNFLCPAQLDKPLITVDAVPGSPNNGTIYVYYTLFCNDQPCVDGKAHVPAFSSAILESHAAGANLPFSTPAKVTGSFVQDQFSDMVIDSHGTPHIFFDDFTAPSGVIRMRMSTLKNGTWQVTATPVASFFYNGLNSLNWGFRDFGTVAPGCGISGDTAYCAFSASQISGGPLEGTPSVYVAVVNTQTGSSTIHRVNNDPFGNGRHHFFPWATAKADGSVYVGWYDDRNDPALTKVEYFVGKSTDGGNTFPVQQAVSTKPFNPCVGFPGCGFFGDYTQIIAGPDGVVHAAWADTRDGASMQIYTQAVTW
jgi:hypothetical protein